MALKKQLREQYLASRRSLTETQVTEASAQIAAQFFQHFPPQAGQTIHTFLPIRRNREVDTWLIIESIRANYSEVQVAVSVSNPLDRTMTHFLLEDDTEIVPNSWGIPEPVSALLLPESEISMVLVPLLAADRQGHRVGYGKGFYDRFLALLPKTSLKLGLAFDPPVDMIDDVTSHDLVLDALITPKEVISFEHLSS